MPHLHVHKIQYGSGCTSGTYRYVQNWTPLDSQLKISCVNSICARIDFIWSVMFSGWSKNKRGMHDYSHTLVWQFLTNHVSIVTLYSLPAAAGTVLGLNHTIICSIATPSDIHFHISWATAAGTILLWISEPSSDTIYYANIRLKNYNCTTTCRDEHR